MGGADRHSGRGEDREGPSVAQRDRLNVETPEERELIRKRAELAALEAELVQRELDLATLHGVLRVFEAFYLRIVGARYAVLDELEARIAEAEAHLSPQDPGAQTRAAEARAQAQESAQAARVTEGQAEPSEFKPPDDLKRLYREVAKTIHPDLAVDDKERVRRTKLMADANRAYETGDPVQLQAILRDWQTGPESVKGDGPGVDLVRAIRKIAQVEQRLKTIEAELARLEASDLYRLKLKADEAAGEGRDLLSEMAAQVDRRLDAAHRRLAALRRMGQRP